MPRVVAVVCRLASGSHPIAERGPALRRALRAVHAWSGSVLRTKVLTSGVKVPAWPVCVPGWCSAIGWTPQCEPGPHTPLGAVALDCPVRGGRAVRARRSRAVRAPRIPRPRIGARPDRSGSWGHFEGSRVTLLYQVKSAAFGGAPLGESPDKESSPSRSHGPYSSTEAPVYEARESEGNLNESTLIQHKVSSLWVCKVEICEKRNSNGPGVGRDRDPLTLG